MNIQRPALYLRSDLTLDHQRTERPKEVFPWNLHQRIERTNDISINFAVQLGKKNGDTAAVPVMR